MLKTFEKMLAVPNSLQKVNGWSCSSRLWHPRQFSCDCLSNSCRPVLNPGSEGRIRLQAPSVQPSAVFQQSFNSITPGTLCAAFSSLSIKINKLICLF